MPAVETIYGFAVPQNLTPQQRQERQASASAASANSEAWTAALGKQNGAIPHGKKLKKLLRGGVPPELRPRVWFEVSEASQLRHAYGHTYYTRIREELRSGAYVVPDSAASQIELDLPRTFPGVAVLRTEPVQQSLRTILSLLAKHCSDVGYCQGLNFIAGLLLLIMQDEESTFWVLAALLQRKLYPATYTSNLRGCHVELRVLSSLIALKLPKLHRHLESLGADMSIFASDLYLCLYCTAMPIEVVVRIWDSLLYEPKSLHRMALAIFTMCEPQLLKQDNAGEALRVVKEFAASLYDIPTFFHHAFNKVGSLPMAKIQALRKSELVHVTEMLKKREEH